MLCTGEERRVVEHFRTVIKEKDEEGCHLLYLIFTRRERIKMYKETPLLFSKTQNVELAANST